jgi:mannose-6-phosphate isomerase-like protein (cupin superfamily)
MTTRSNRLLSLPFILAIAAGLGTPSPTHADAPLEMKTLTPETVKYISIPDMPACATAAILRGNPRSGPAWVFLKLDSGCRIPWHWHTANESLMVISGRGKLEMKDGPTIKFTPGAFADLPSHHQHQATCTQSCLFFNAADDAFDIHYMDPAGDEISLEEALKLPARRKTKKP